MGMRSAAFARPMGYPVDPRTSSGIPMRRAYSLERVRLLLGHAHIRTAELYAEEELKDAADMLERTG